jgi:hypothetical protein
MLSCVALLVVLNRILSVDKPVADALAGKRSPVKTANRLVHFTRRAVSRPSRLFRQAPLIVCRICMDRLLFLAVAVNATHPWLGAKTMKGTSLCGEFTTTFLFAR